jgi:hypothetical protein
MFFDCGEELWMVKIGLDGQGSGALFWLKIFIDDALAAGRGNESGGTFDLDVGTHLRL